MVVLRTIQILLLLTYAALPAAMLGWAVYSRVRHARIWPTASLVFSAMAGGAIAISILMLNRWLMGGSIPLTEYARAIYFAIAAICLVKLIDHWLLRGLMRLGRVPLDRWGRPITPNAPRALGILFAQRLLMLCVVVSYLGAVLLAYRPKLITGTHPGQLKPALHFADVRFPSADGLNLSGWWIAAAERPSLPDAEIARHWGRRTVLLCHGVGSGKERMIELARRLSENGLNVFLFDFRGHGRSEWDFISYGDRERFDVLGAAKWIKANHAPEAERLFGLGVNTGAAALLGAAAADSEQELLDGLVLYEPFAHFKNVVDAAAGFTLPAGIGWLVGNVSVPLAGLHGGSNLSAFRPVDQVAGIWPRPILVIHGQGESFVPNVETMSVFQEASYPKEQFWPADNYQDRLQRQRLEARQGQYAGLAELFREYIGTSESLSSDAGVLRRTVQFIYGALPSPVI